VTTYRCRYCDYFLCESDLKSGSVRLVCRRCKAGQTVKFSERESIHHALGPMLERSR
jgi:phage FluMu protein Com